MVKLASVPKILTQKLIRFYQKYISLDQGILKGLGVRMCRYDPTCSQYAYESIEKYGFIKGGIRASYRILRCNPFSKGGHDPVR